MKRIFVAAAVTVLCLPAAVAQADPVQEFGFRLRDVKPDGRYTAVFTSRSYDSTGAPPSALVKSEVRFAAGIAFRRWFLTSRYRCDVQLLLDALSRTPEDGILFSKRVEDLTATLKRTRGRLNAKEIKNIEVCARSHSGWGRVVVDARPLIDDLIPANIYLYLTKPTVPGAAFSFGVLSVLDENAAVVKNNPILQNVRVIVNTDVAYDPSPDGTYGWKIILPTGPVNGLKISIAELNVINPGVWKTTTRTSCLRRAGGRCVSKKTTKSLLFWVTQPTCPATGKLSFQANYEYETGSTSTKTIEIPCPRFKQRSAP